MTSATNDFYFIEMQTDEKSLVGMCGIPLALLDKFYSVPLYSLLFTQLSIVLPTLTRAMGTNCKGKL